VINLHHRLAALTVALIPLTLLGVASQLQPASAGLGTHQQLGLPPCSLRVLLAIRCPACGMTTSWAHFVRGEWLASASVNLGGFLLALAAIATSGLFLHAAWRARMPSIEAQRWLSLAAVAIAVVTITDWGRRLAGW